MNLMRKINVLLKLQWVYQIQTASNLKTTDVFNALSAPTLILKASVCYRIHYAKSLIRWLEDASNVTLAMK